MAVIITGRYKAYTSVKQHIVGDYKAVTYRFQYGKVCFKGNRILTLVWSRFIRFLAARKRSY